MIESDKILLLLAMVKNSNSFLKLLQIIFQNYRILGNVGRKLSYKIQWHMPNILFPSDWL